MLYVLFSIVISVLWIWRRDDQCHYNEYCKSFLLWKINQNQEPPAKVWFRDYNSYIIRDLSNKLVGLSDASLGLSDANLGSIQCVLVYSTPTVYSMIFPISSCYIFGMASQSSDTASGTFCCVPIHKHEVSLNVAAVVSIAMSIFLLRRCSAWGSIGA